jgi:hypothetical protein
LDPFSNEVRHAVPFRSFSVLPAIPRQGSALEKFRLLPGGPTGEEHALQPNRFKKNNSSSKTEEFPFKCIQ